MEGQNVKKLLTNLYVLFRNADMYKEQAYENWENKELREELTNKAKNKMAEAEEMLITFINTK